jgi:nucleotide-binding universal stress UspA family protein
VPLSVDEVGRIEKEWTDHGQAVVDAVTEGRGRQGLKAKPVLVKSDLMAEALLAGEAKCDLIVMASHGRKDQAPAAGQRNPACADASTIPVLVLR